MKMKPNITYHKVYMNINQILSDIRSRLTLRCIQFNYNV